MYIYILYIQILYIHIIFQVFRRFRRPKKQKRVLNISTYTEFNIGSHESINTILHNTQPNQHTKCHFQFLLSKLILLKIGHAF